ncbi:MAG: hypothetical protein NBV67_01495 [Tagaea sp.]|nr:hypothetical protein [Tagaea sp.]
MIRTAQHRNPSSVPDPRADAGEQPGARGFVAIVELSTYRARAGLQDERQAGAVVEAILSSAPRT